MLRKSVNNVALAWKTQIKMDSSVFSGEDGSQSDLSDANFTVRTCKVN